MKKSLTILSILFISLAFVAPMQVSAAWWNPISWFSKSQPVEEREKSPSDNSNSTASESQTVNQNVEAMEKPNTVTPVVNSQPSDVKTIESLKSEITTLKTNLDNLYKAHNSLVNDHNTLLKSTTDLEKRFSTLQNQPAANNVSSDILYRVSELERKAKLTSEELYGNGIGGGLNLRVSKLESAGGSNLDTKMNNLERTLNDICRSAFSSPSCPIMLIGGNLESRIKKLEGGY